MRYCVPRNLQLVSNRLPRSIDTASKGGIAAGQCLCNGQSLTIYQPLASRLPGHAQSARSARDTARPDARTAASQSPIIVAFREERGTSTLLVAVPVPVGPATARALATKCRPCRHSLTPPLYRTSSSVRLISPTVAIVGSAWLGVHVFPESSRSPSFFSNSLFFRFGFSPACGTSSGVADALFTCCGPWAILAWRT